MEEVFIFTAAGVCHGSAHPLQLVQSSGSRCIHSDTHQWPLYFPGALEQKDGHVHGPLLPWPPASVVHLPVFWAEVKKWHFPEGESMCPGKAKGIDRCYSSEGMSPGLLQLSPESRLAG